MAEHSNMKAKQSLSDSRFWNDQPKAKKIIQEWSNIRGNKSFSEGELIEQLSVNYWIDQ